MKDNVLSYFRLPNASLGLSVNRNPANELPVTLAGLLTRHSILLFEKGLICACWSESLQGIPQMGAYSHVHRNKGCYKRSQLTKCRDSPNGFICSTLKKARVERPLSHFLFIVSQSRVFNFPGNIFSPQTIGMVMPSQRLQHMDIWFLSIQLSLTMDPSSGPGHGSVLSSIPTHILRNFGIHVSKFSSLLTTNLCPPEGGLGEQDMFQSTRASGKGPLSIPNMTQMNILPWWVNTTVFIKQGPSQTQP